MRLRERKNGDKTPDGFSENIIETLPSLAFCLDHGAGPHTNNSANRVSTLSARGWYSENHHHVPRCLSFASQAHECDSNERTAFFPSLRENTE